MKGGVANAGAVVRVGQHVLRPSNPHTPSIHAFLDFLVRTGFDGASQPIGVDPDGRERLRFIEGDVALPPYPAWAQTDEALASIARLMRRYHDAAAAFVPGPGHTWSDEMADPESGTIVCHNDVCLENVVFRDGEAVGLLDFDFAAPGRPVFDLACFARMCVPIDDDSRTRFGWTAADLPKRLRLVADAYGLTAPREGGARRRARRHDRPRRRVRAAQGGSGRRAVHRDVALDGRHGSVRSSSSLVGRRETAVRRRHGLTTRPRTDCARLVA